MLKRLSGLENYIYKKLNDRNENFKRKVTYNKYKTSIGTRTIGVFVCVCMGFQNEDSCSILNIFLIAVIRFILRKEYSILLFYYFRMESQDVY